MMLSLSFAALQFQSVPLTPFLDDGGTTIRPVDPSLLPLSGHGGTQATVVRVGARTFRLRLRDASGGKSLAVDLNGDGTIQSNEKVAWERQTHTLSDGSLLTSYQGELSLSLDGRRTVRYGVRYLQSRTKDPAFARVRDHLMLLPEFGFTGVATFGGKRMRIGIRGGDVAQGSLFVDRDGDGVLGTVPAEVFAMARPFNIGGTSYRVAAFDPLGRPFVRFGPSSRSAVEVPMPPNLSVGHLAPSLASRTLRGKPLAFPGSFKGKLVLLDVWATWCGPCRAEIPYLKYAYYKHRARGFEIVSFSIDDPGTQPKVAAFAKSAGETWTQAFEGKGWASPVCRRYNITSIPFFLLVDGSTGRIVAAGEGLRGPSMEPTIAAALARRGR